MLKYVDYEQHGRNAIFYAAEDYLKKNKMQDKDFEVVLGECKNFYSSLRYRISKQMYITDFYLGVLENYLVVNGIAEDRAWF